MRATPLLSLLVLVGATACSPSGVGDSAAASSAGVTAIELSDFMLDPSSLTVTGPAVTIEVTSAGPTPHNLSIRDADGEIIAATDDLSSGDAATLRAQLEPGEYVIFCSLAGHESLGMTGTLTVTGSP